MIYQATSFFVHWALREFFCEIHVEGTVPSSEAPAIIVGNHPNMMFDAFIVAATVQRKMWFLGKSTLFDMPVLGWLLPALRVVPVYRRQDNPTAVGKNEGIFDKVCSRLGAGDAIALFPEGTSMGERRLYPIKTGAARIAFQTLHRYPEIEDVPIVPLGITYSHLRNFRGSVTVFVGESLSSRAYASDDPEDRDQVKALTASLETALKDVTVEVPDERDAELVDRISSLYRTASIGSNDFERMKAVAHYVNSSRDKDTEEAKELVDRMEQFSQDLRALGLSDNEPLDSRISAGFALLATLPVTVGALIHSIPYHLTGPLAMKMADDKMYVATWKLVLGLSFFLLTYVVLLVLAWYAGASWPLLLLLFSICVTSGGLANRHFGDVLLFWYGCLPGSLNPLGRLRTERNSLIERLEAFA